MFVDLFCGKELVRSIIFCVRFRVWCFLIDSLFYFLLNGFGSGLGVRKRRFDLFVYLFIEIKICRAFIICWVVF